MHEQVRSGEYASASEVVRDGLRLLEARKRYREAKLAALQGEIRAGLEGPATPAQDVIAAARARDVDHDDFDVRGDAGPAAGEDETRGG